MRGHFTLRTPLTVLVDHRHRWARAAGFKEHDAADVVQEFFQAVFASLNRFRRDQPGDKARYLASITGMTKSVMWHGFQQGEVLLLGATGMGG
jgi:DNA-directed RNA polymerase specialized sigma24 family protein